MALSVLKLLKDSILFGAGRGGGFPASGCQATTCLWAGSRGSPHPSWSAASLMHLFHVCHSDGSGWMMRSGDPSVSVSSSGYFRISLYPQTFCSLCKSCKYFASWIFYTIFLCDQGVIYYERLQTRRSRFSREPLRSHLPDSWCLNRCVQLCFHHSERR